MNLLETLSNLNLILQGKNTNRISDCNAINSFIATLVEWHRRVQKRKASSFLYLKTVLEKNHIEAKVEFNTAV